MSDTFELVVNSQGKLVQGYPEGLTNIANQLVLLQKQIDELKSTLARMEDKFPSAIVD